MTIGRQLRDPLPRAEFDALSLRPTPLKLTGKWWNLRWRSYATAEKTFFASLTGRLTPETGKVKCLYLARTMETSFEELYGDHYDAEEKRSSVLRLPLSDATERVFLHTSGPLQAKVYDLNAPGAAKKIGLDLGTLYAPAIQHTRAFAQRLHDHPEGFDGILYRSRLMNTRCVVLWKTHGLRDLPLQLHSRLIDQVEMSEALDPDCLFFSRRTKLITV